MNGVKHDMVQRVDLGVQNGLMNVNNRIGSNSNELAYTLFLKGNQREFPYYSFQFSTLVIVKATKQVRKFDSICSHVHMYTALLPICLVNLRDYSIHHAPVHI